jgi:membrane associated rhomboid family serine protease
MRTTVIVSLAVLGAGVGFLGDVIFWQGRPQAPVLGVAGLLVGLLLGALVAATFRRRRPHRLIDTERRPNRIIRRV